MQKKLEKKTGKKFWDILFSSLVFFSRFQFTTDLRDVANQEFFILFYWKGSAIWEKNRIFHRITTHFVNRLNINSGRNHTSFIGFNCKSMYPRTNKVHSAAKTLTILLTSGLQEF